MLVTVQQAALLAFVALMGIAWPPPPVAVNAEWADAAMLVAGGALAISWIAGAPRRTLGRGAMLAGAGYAAWALLSALAHHAGWWKAVGIAELVCVAVVAANVTARPTARDRLLRVWLGTSVVLAAFALAGAALVVAHVPSPLYSARGGDLNLPWRARGLCITSNMLASQLLAPLVLLFADGRRLLGSRRRALALTVIGLAFALTLSRTWLALALAVLLLGTRGWLRIAGTAVLVVAALMTMRLDLYRQADGRLVVSTAPGLRWRLATAAVDSARAHPLVGVGPTTEPAVVPWPRPTDPPAEMSAHSTALDVAARLGAPALLLFVLMCALVLRDGLRGVQDVTQRALLCALVALLFDGLTMDVENFRHLWLLVGLVSCRSAC